MDTRVNTPEQPALYVVATPIGNLADLSARAGDILRSVELVAAEDTRVTATLLRHVGANPKELVSTHAHNERGRIERIVALLRAGASCALVSDAGTPAISDPGARLVAGVRAAGLRVVPVPGASAVTTLLCAAGIDADRFGAGSGRWHFEGFLPARAGQRRKRLAELGHWPAVLVLMEGPHRIAACLDDLAAQFGGERLVIIGRELTKRFEQIVELRLADAPAWLAADPNHQRGEFVLAVAPAAPGYGATASTVADDTLSADTPLNIATAAGALMSLLLAELPPPRAARLARQLTGRTQDDFYALAQAVRRDPGQRKT